MKHRHVFLSQANNVFGENAFLPYSVALLWSYAKTFAKVRENFSLLPFHIFRDPVDEVVDLPEKPDVAGFSCYIWNWEYNKKVIKALRKAYPDCLIVLGGPQVPTNSTGFFEQFPEVDVLVHFEGEEAFAEILMAVADDKTDFSDIRGLSVKSKDGSTLKTENRDRINDINAIPSPYLDGLFDDLLKLPYSFHASQETHRGCPYSCTFCDWGSAVFTKVRKFDDERLCAEIDWMSNVKIELVYNCDANYGMLKRDVELTRYMAEVGERTGFPKKFRAAYAKNSNKRVFEIAKILNAQRMSKGITLSLQSMDEQVLGAIKRQNIRFDDFGALIEQYRELDIPTYTELILGLPGESLEGFADALDRLLMAGQHEGIFINLCMVLPNSEMGDPDYIAQYGIKMRRLPLDLSHVTPVEEDIVEYNDVVIETRDLPHDDWRTAFSLSWLVQSFHCMGLTRKIAIYLHQKYGLAYKDFYSNFLRYALQVEGTVIHDEYNHFLECVERGLAGEKFDVVLPRFGETTWPIDEATFLRCIEKKDRFYADLKAFLVWLGQEAKIDLTPEQAEELVVFQQNMLVDPWQRFAIGFETNLDVHNLLAADQILDASLAGNVEEWRVRVEPETEFDGNCVEYAREVVWYGRKGGKFLHSRVSAEPVASRVESA